MQALQQEIRALRQSVGANASLTDVAAGLTAALQSHPEAMGALAGRYRLQTMDTGFHLAFEASDAGFALLSSADAVDVCVQGTEKELLKLVQGEGDAMRALLLGRLKLRGDIRFLQKFAKIL